MRYAEYYVCVKFSFLIFRTRRQEAKIKLLSRTRRSSKKAKNSKKRGKLGSIGRLGNSATFTTTPATKPSKKSKKKKNSKNKNKIQAQHISSKNDKKGLGRNDENRLNNQKPARSQSFRSCTGSLVSPKCLVTTAACTGKGKDVRLFAKIGERRYGAKGSSLKSN